MAISKISKDLTLNKCHPLSIPKGGSTTVSEPLAAGYNRALAVS